MVPSFGRGSVRDCGRHSGTVGSFGAAAPNVGHAFADVDVESDGLSI
ncbi:hypothetical protein ACWEFJ_30545 [Actinosynnema sp. NPDC004786]